MPSPTSSPRARSPRSSTTWTREVDRIWSELRFEARWQSQAERREARAALSRFLAYHVRRDRELVDTEAFVGTRGRRARPRTAAPTPSTCAASSTGSSATARAASSPIDLKNMRGGVREKDIPEHGQLGVYQLIIREGGLDGEPAPEVGGAALVQLRIPAGTCRRRPEGAVPGGARRPESPDLDRDPAGRGGADRSATRRSSPPSGRAAATAPTARPARRSPRASRCCRDRHATAPLRPRGLPGRSRRRARLLAHRRAVGRGVGILRPRRHRGRCRVGQDHVDGRTRGLARRQRLRPARRGPRADVHDEGDRPAADVDASVAGRPSAATRPRSEAIGDDGRRSASASRRCSPTTPSPPASSPSTASGSAASRVPACSPTARASSSPIGSCAARHFRCARSAGRRSTSPATCSVSTTS